MCATSQLRLFLFLALYLLVHILRVRSHDIRLKDNTPNGTRLAVNILPELRGEPKIYSLLQTRGSQYFALNNRTGQLSSARFIDRDLLCQESGLCCPGSPMATLMDTICSGLMYSSSIYVTQTRPGQRFGSAVPAQACIFNLSVSVVSETGQQPDIYPITITICEENDHAPQFKIPSTEKPPGSARISRPSTDQFLPESMQYTVNISEAVPVGHRIPLPLAEDIDAPPFNVRRYELERLDSAVPVVPGFVHSRSSQARFRLEMAWDSGTRSGSGTHDTLPYASDETRGNIARLELLLIEPLDRESVERYEYRVLAIDGGSPPLTGTLMLEIRVVDTNDHAPRFTKPVYETKVDEGVMSEKIIQLVADDADEGPNAVIRYDWPEAFNMATRTRSNLTQSTGRKEPASLDELKDAPPSYWFHLDEKTGIISVRRPLDYEVKAQHRFHVIAHNPVASKITADTIDRPGSPHRIMTSTASVIVNVRNLDDEPPQIMIDYASGRNQNYTEIKENSPSPFFVAFVTVSDPDITSELTKLSMHRGSSADLGPFPDPVVSCSLESHQDAYILKHQNIRTEANLVETRYSLLTQRPLDREQSAIDRILIVCQDSGSPPRTATATAEVRVLDENDCTPIMQVFSPFKIHGNRQEPLDPWPFAKLGQWIEKTRETNAQIHSSLRNAYVAQVPVFTVHVAENQPAGTIFARVWATDLDAGENGRVTYELPHVPLLINISHSSNPVYTDHRIQMNDRIELSSSSIALDLFRVDPTRGDVSTCKVIDREEGETILEQVFLVVQAKDHGDPSRTAFLLLHILIDDENDNPPVFLESKMHFTIRENVPAPAIVGEIRVIDPDLRPMRTFDLDPLPYGSSGSSYSGRADYAILRPHSQIPLKNSLHVRIDPSHNRRDLPFILFPTTDGRFLLNTTRALDRESEEAFQFVLIAVDGGDVFQSTHITSDRLDLMGSRKMKHRTATASVVVIVLDENDNHPEIIFPNPSASNSTVHRVSFREPAGYEIVNINANDRDAGETNGKFYFELIPGSRSEDLFTIDRVTGLLRTRRRLTKEDLGEYTLHVIVRDQGDPPLETQLTLHLIVDQSEPHWPYSMRSNLNYFGARSATSHSSIAASGGEDYPPKESSSLTLDGVHLSDGELIGPGGLKRPIHADIVLFVIVALILGLIIVMFGLCLYLRHKKNLFLFLPDLCGFCAGGSPRGVRAMDTKTSYTKTYGDLEHRGAAHPNSTIGGASPGLLTNLLSGDNVMGKKLLPSNSTSPLQSPIPSGRGQLPSHLATSMSGPYAQSHSRSSFNLNGTYGNYPGSSKDPMTAVVCPLIDGMPIRQGLAFSPTMIGPEGLFCPSANSAYRPGTTMAVNIPDVANQAETIRKQYAGYCRTAHSGLEYGPHAEHAADSPDFVNSMNGPANMYNVGHYLGHRSRPTYGPPDEVSSVFVPTSSFEQFPRFGFPVMDEDMNPYQRIAPTGHYMGNQAMALVSNPLISKRSHGRKTRYKTGQTSNASSINTTIAAADATVSRDQAPAPCDLGEQQHANGGTVWKNQLTQWRSDPSLNHFEVMSPIAPYALRSGHRSTYEFNNTIHANATPRRLLKRSNSNKHTHGRGVNGYYSTLHESAKQSGSPKTILADFSGSKLASDETARPNENYAVSFPKLQASFV
ncbi:hypothetical protein D915_005342 [Fasciola hepatica]|uniref:Cadherin domain-containing protein n=1 Tax=Fasciola hepatica TaxID=6192 RepID=A0A4E0RBN6_FASHE|nr:hypothetical protein D915_005342 [Fasciola hepatica]